MTPGATVHFPEATCATCAPRCAAEGQCLPVDPDRPLLQRLHPFVVGVLARR